MSEKDLIGKSYDYNRTALKRKLYHSETAALAARLILGAVFIYASLDKIINTADFAEVVYNYRILPGSLINIAAIVLPWLEFLAGISLVAGIWVYGASFLIASLMLSFFSAILFNFIRGLDINCGCFSTNADLYPGGHMIWYLIRDGIFLMLSIYLFLGYFFKKVAAKTDI